MIENEQIKNAEKERDQCHDQLELLILILVLQSE